MLLQLLFAFVLTQTVEFRPELEPGLGEATNNATVLAVAIERANAANGAVVLPSGEYHIDPAIHPGEIMYVVDGLVAIQGAGKNLTRLRLPTSFEYTEPFNLFAVRENTKHLTVSGVTIHGPSPPDYGMPGFDPDLQPNTAGFYFESCEIGTAIFEDIEILGGFKDAIKGNRNYDHPGEDQHLIVRDFGIETYDDGISWFSSSEFPPRLTVERGWFKTGIPADANGVPRGANVYAHPNVPTTIRDVRCLQSWRKCFQFNGGSNPETATGAILIENCEFAAGTGVGILLSDVLPTTIRNCTFRGASGILVRNNTTVTDSWFYSPIAAENYGVDGREYRARFRANEFVDSTVVAGSGTSWWAFDECHWWASETGAPFSGMLLTSKNMATKVMVRGGGFHSDRVGTSMIAMIRHRGGELRVDGAAFDGLAPFNGGVLTSDQAAILRVENSTFNFTPGGQTFASRAYWHDAGRLVAKNNTYCVDRILEGGGSSWLVPRDEEQPSVTSGSTIQLDPNVTRYLVTGSTQIGTVTFGNYSPMIGPIYLTSTDGFELVTGGNILNGAEIPDGETAILTWTPSGWAVTR